MVVAVLASLLLFPFFSNFSLFSIFLFFQIFPSFSLPFPFLFSRYIPTAVDPGVLVSTKFESAGCADTFDIGETSYGMVLADDLDGDGRLELLVATMNGNVYAFDTWQRYHPLKAWPSQVGLPQPFLSPTLITNGFPVMPPYNPNHKRVSHCASLQP
jgi:hypothetical protein